MKALPLGRVAGVPVLLMPSWFVLAGFVVLAYGPAFDARGGYPAAAVFAVLLLGSVVLHEVGHCVVARVLGLPVRSITITLLAGLTEITEPPQTPAREYAVAVAGPLVSLWLAGAATVLGAGLPDGSSGAALAALVGITNLAIAVFNLLPGLPLDGGRVLRAGVWQLTRDQDRATIASAQAGRVVALVLAPAALLLTGPLLGNGVSLSAVVVTVLVAGFVYSGATAALRSARVLRRVRGVTVGQLARQALAVRADLPLAEALRRAEQAGLRAVVVTAPDGRVEGLLSEAAALAVPAERRPYVLVGSLARAVDQGQVLDPALSGEALLAALRRHPRGEHLAVDPRTGEARVLATSDVVRAAGQ